MTIILVDPLAAPPFLWMVAASAYVLGKITGTAIMRRLGVGERAS